VRACVRVRVCACVCVCVCVCVSVCLCLVTRTPQMKHRLKVQLESIQEKNTDRRGLAVRVWPLSFVE
jgi:hypothetical protein